MTITEAMAKELVKRTPKVERGSWLVIDTNGKSTLHDEKPTHEKICQVLGCDAVDSVILSYLENGMGDTVMLVDDEGLMKNLPVNLRATALYALKCGGLTETAIHGNVAFIRDEDF